MENGFSTNDIFSIFFIVFGLYEFATGIAGFVKGKIYNNAKHLTERYTEESLQKYAKPYGIGTALLGLCLILLEVAFAGPRYIPSLNKTVVYIIGGILLVAALVIMIVSNKMLVKK